MNNIHEMYRLLVVSLERMERTMDYWNESFSNWHDCNLDNCDPNLTASNDRYRSILEFDLKDRMQEILTAFDEYRKCAERNATIDNRS